MDDPSYFNGEGSPYFDFGFCFVVNWLWVIVFKK